MLGFGYLGIYPVVATQPPTVVHAVFHVASIAFNSPETESPVWLAYQAGGNQSSEGMPVGLRMQLVAVICLGSLAAALWEKLAVMRWLGGVVTTGFPNVATSASRTIVH